MLLDPKLIRKLRNVVNSTNIFHSYDEYKDKFNLICAVMDKFDTAVCYINENYNNITDEIKLIQYMSFVAIIHDGVKYLYQEVMGIKLYKSHIENKNILTNLISNDLFSNRVNDDINDEDIFEYLRSIIMAHPFETSRANFLKNNKNVQYCPWIDCKNNRISLRIYSNIKDGFLDIEIDKLNEYILYTYGNLIYVIDWFQKQVISYEEKWKNFKVDRTLTEINQLIMIRDELINRKHDYYNIENAIQYLTVKLTDENNLNNVIAYRNEIIKRVPNIVDAFERYNYEEVEDELSIINIRPKNAHKMCDYQMEKIFNYLVKESPSYNCSNYIWGLSMYKSFYDELAKNYISYNEKMSGLELRLLANVAAYFHNINNT